MQAPPLRARVIQGTPSGAKKTSFVFGVDPGVPIAGWPLAKSMGPTVHVLPYSRVYSGGPGVVIGTENRASLGWGWEPA